VRRAVLKRDPAAQAQLRALLRKGDADLPGDDDTSSFRKARSRC
jgi:hypothetical protein